jgi:hypothetical protein
VASLASERDTLAGKAAQQAADLAEAQQGRTAAEQQAAVLAARLDACAEARAERDEARKVAAEAREQAARLAWQLETLQQKQQK